MTAEPESYRIVYCSRNSLPGQEQAGEAIRDILVASRDNNRRVGVSGALLFNAGCFAQVLEGDRSAVEEIYERIACDSRHRDITILEAGYAPRDFAEWSMAYAARVPDGELEHLIGTLDAAFSGTNPRGEEVLALMRRIVLEAPASA